MTQVQSTTLKGIRTSSFFEKNDLILEQDEIADLVLIKRVSSGKLLGSIKQADSRLAEGAELEIYEGKGGLAAILTTAKGTKYFALSGSKVAVSGFSLELLGDRIPESAGAPTLASSFLPAQTATPHAVILGAGLATRFEPVSGDNTQNSKPGIPLLGEKSVIRLIAESLVKSGFSDIFINTYYKRESLKEGLKGIEGASLHYLDELEPSGTAGGLRQIFDEPEKYSAYFSADKPLFVVQGDAITDTDFSVLMQAHVDNNAALTIGCMIKPDEDVDKFGIVATDQSGKDGKSGKIQMFLEKPSLEEAGDHRLANTGFYIFAPETFPLIRKVYNAKMLDASADKNSKGEVVLDFAMHIFPEVLKQVNAGNIKDRQGESKPFWAQVVKGYWSDIGNPSQYIQSLRDLYAGKANIQLPENREMYYDAEGIIYWPKAKERAVLEKAELSGNVVVALPFETS